MYLDLASLVEGLVGELPPTCDGQVAAESCASAAFEAYQVQEAGLAFIDSLLGGGQILTHTHTQSHWRSKL